MPSARTVGRSFAARAGRPLPARRCGRPTSFRLRRPGRARAAQGPFCGRVSCESWAVPWQDSEREAHHLQILARKARDRRGNHARGTPSERPSSSRIVSRSKANFLPLTEMLVPSPLLPALTDLLGQFCQPFSAVASASGNLHLQPEFRLAATDFRTMDMHQLPRRSFIKSGAVISRLNRCLAG